MYGEEKIIALSLLILPYQIKKKLEQQCHDYVTSVFDQTISPSLLM